MRIHTYLLPALAALCACSSTPEETTDGSTVARLIELTRYEEALQLSQKLVERRPSAENLAQQELATVAWYLQQVFVYRNNNTFFVCRFSCKDA